MNYLASFTVRKKDFEQALVHHKHYHDIRFALRDKKSDQYLKSLEIRYQAETEKERSKVQAQKNAELDSLNQKLQVSETQQQALLERASDGVIILQDQITRYVNPEMCKILGAAKEDLIGQRFGNHLAPEERPKILERYQRRLRGEAVPSRYETKVIQPDGREVFVDINAGTLDYEGRPAVLAIVRDVSEEKAIARQIQESEARFRLLVDTLDAHVYLSIVNEQNEFKNIYNSPRIEAMTGYPLEKIEKDWNFWVEVLIYPEDREKAASQAKRLTQGKNSEVEYRMRCADGRTIWVQDSAQVANINGQRHVFGLVRDITEHKKLRLIWPRP